ncbi:MAG: heme-binding protein [Geminicoccaceae bacterium]
MLSWFGTIVTGLALGACSLVGIRGGYEQPPYTVVQHIGDSVEIREYGPRLAAEVTVPAGDPEAARGDAFRALAGYIFGGNKGETKVAMTVPVETSGEVETIAMTAPVATTTSGGEMTMRFFLPATLTASTAPVPNDSRVHIVELPPTTVAALRFSGSPTEASLAEHQQQLLAALAGTGWQPAGEPSILYYDPPWTVPFLRRNEAVVAVTR